ncbi:MAG: DUF3192 domain-containing protein [Desulfosudaceae bacterium]
MKKFVILILMLALICSCAPALVKTNANLLQLTPGMAQEEVVALMGVPALSELYETTEGDLISILYYRTQKKEATLLSVKDVCTPVVFIDDQLVGWGERLTAAGINLLEVPSR